MHKISKYQIVLGIDVILVGLSFFVPVLPIIVGYIALSFGVILVIYGLTCSNNPKLSIKTESISYLKRTRERSFDGGKPYLRLSEHLWEPEGHTYIDLVNEFIEIKLVFELDKDAKFVKITNYSAEFMKPKNLKSELVSINGLKFEYEALFNEYLEVNSYNEHLLKTPLSLKPGSQTDKIILLRVHGMPKKIKKAKVKLTFYCLEKVSIKKIIKFDKDNTNMKLLKANFTDQII